MANFFLDTKLGSFVKSMIDAKVSDIKNDAYSQSVLNEMADLNTQSQLLTIGVFADGTDTPDYSPYTKQLKGIANKPFEFMTFKDTGETHKSIEYTYSGGDLEVNFEDRFELEKQYGKPIFGLTKQSISEIQPEIMENIQQSILKKL